MRTGPDILPEIKESIAPAAEPRVATKRPDSRTLRTREALLSAGMSLFAERGLHQVSVDDITARAEIAKQTFYNHVPDKMALAQLIFAELRESYLKSLQSLNDGIADPALRLARAVCFYVRKAIDEPDHIRFLSQMLIRETAADDPVNRGLFRDLEAGLSSGRFVFRTLEVGAAFVMGASEPLLAKVLSRKEGADAVGLTHEYLTLILRGLSVPTLDAELLASQATIQIINSDGGRR